LQQAQTLQILVGAGIKTREEARAELGLGAAGAAALGKFMPGEDHQSPGIRAIRTKHEHFLDRLLALPTRADIHDLELRLGDRMESLAVRFDRAFDPRVS
jgi:hypothetical protein